MSDQTLPARLCASIVGVEINAKTNPNTERTENCNGESMIQNKLLST